MRNEVGRGMLTAFSGVGAYLIPAWGCPVCLSAFAGTMSSLGLGFVATQTILTPLTVVFLGAALLALGFGARRRRTYGPLVLGAVAAGLLVATKIWAGQPSVAYLGLGALLAASVWNTRAAVPPSAESASAEVVASPIE